MHIFRIIFISGCIFLAACSPGNQEQNKVPPNVLFICVDDLRPELGCYGNKLMVSPNLDKLADEGCLFTNHFVTTPTCGASRYSLLTGLIPRSGVEMSNEAIRKQISNEPEGEKPESFIHEMPRFPETTSIQKVLSKMQQSRFHMAIVTDKDGRTAGLVTMEDILEEIVGEISDEYLGIQTT